MLQVLVAPEERKEELWEMYREYAHELSEYDQEKRHPGPGHHPCFEVYWVERNRTPFMVLYDHEPVGFCLMQDTGVCYRIDEFYIRPLHRQRGFGKRAVERVKEHCLKWGRHNILAANIYVNNEPAIRFWQSLGFRDTGRRQRLKRVRLMETEVDLQEQAEV